MKSVYQINMRETFLKYASFLLLVTAIMCSSSPAGTNAAENVRGPRKGPANSAVSDTVSRDGAGSSRSAAPDSTPNVSFERNPLLQLPAEYSLPRMSLMFSAEPRLMPDFTGYTTRMRSRAEMTLMGAGSAASLGLAAGAMGEMLGAWDEDASWVIGGVMTAFGAIYGGKVKADDRTWNLEVRWDPHPERGGE